MRVIGPIGLGAAVMLAAAVTAQSQRAPAMSFDDDKPGGPPPGFTFAPWRQPTAGTWAIRRQAANGYLWHEADAAATGYSIALAPRARAPRCLRDRTAPAGRRLPRRRVWSGAIRTSRTTTAWCSTSRRGDLTLLPRRRRQSRLPRSRGRPPARRRRLAHAPRRPRRRRSARVAGRHPGLRRVGSARRPHGRGRPDGRPRTGQCRGLVRRPADRGRSKSSGGERVARASRANGAGIMGPRE